MKRIIYKPAKLILRVLSGIIRLIRGPAKTKVASELRYWKKQTRKGPLKNKHYKYYFTTNFKLNEDFYRNKKILDVGCGPRGSLEWADMASERIGLDPLADSYRKFQIDHHKMKYVTAPSEEIPFPDRYFDVVSSFNSLDHVDNLEQTVKEIIRVIAPSGRFLLIVEVDHPPTTCEPISFSWDITKKFLPDLALVEEKHFESARGGIYESISVGIPYEHSNNQFRKAVLAAHFRKPD